MKTVHEYDIYKLPTTLPLSDDVKDALQSMVHNAVRTGRIIAFKEVIMKIDTMEASVIPWVFKSLLVRSALGTLKAICLKFIAHEENIDFKEL